jgi:hypothetical protein
VREKKVSASSWRTDITEALRPRRNERGDCADSLSENEDKDHSDEDPRLLSDSTNTSITDDSDGETGGETGETDRKSGTELDETGVEGHGGLELAGDEDRDDEAVDLRKGVSACRDFQQELVASRFGRGLGERKERDSNARQ